MKRFFHLLIPTIIFCYAGVLAQTVTLSTYGISPRDSERDTVDHYFDRPYNGLLNVGKETKMFFKASVDEGFLHPVWSIDGKPAGSTAEFGATKDVDDLTQIISFIPDLVGTYKISVTSDTSTASLTINSALYLGINSTPPNCVNCHNNAYFDYKVDEWSKTGHASMLERGLDGTLSSHYGESCINCHTTGYDPEANNDGFDDFPFVFPDSLYPGVYDMTVAAYPEAMQRANIQCESCHGPASGHNGLINDSRMQVSLNTDVCAYCHDEGSHHAFPEQWDYSGKDASFYDGRGFEGGHAIGAFVQSAGTRSGCSPCHSGAGFIEWVEEGRPVDSDGLPAATDILPKATNISCAVCHDPHDATNEHQLRYADTQLGDGTPLTFDKYGTGLQCMQCHRSRRNAKTYASDVSNESSHYGAHHGPQADMLLGKNAPDFGIDLPSSPHGVVVVPGEDQGNACVNCHMAGALADANGNINHVGGHTWNMNDVEGHDNVAACEPCHGDIGTSFKDKKYYINGNADLDGNGVAEGLQVEVKGLLDQLSSYLPHDADGNVSITSDNADSLTLTPAIMKAGYAYIWIEEDRSFGIHNPAFTVALIKASIEELGGVLAVDYPKGEGMPEEYKLSQNYPNPFNPATTIEYSIPEQSMVTITIYDVVGKEIEQLYSGEKAAGTYSVQWNAANYASGIYFYKLSTNNFVQVKKMMLLK
jgi:hypothetical protein